MPSPSQILSALKIFCFGPSSLRALMLYGLGKYFYGQNYRRFSRILFNMLERDHGVFIHPSAQFGHNMHFPHPTGIVIGAHVKIGDDVTIFQQVTLGGARLGDTCAGRSPAIGNGTVIFAGAKILGQVTVGENCIIGANAVVNRDIPPDHVAVGVPARIFPRDKTQPTPETN